MQKSLKIFIIIFIFVLIASGIIFYVISNKNVFDSNTTKDKNVYAIVNKNFNLFEIDSERSEDYQGIKLYEYNNSNSEYAEIYYISYDYYTDFSSTYNISIKDNNGNSLLLDDNNNIVDEKELMGGMIASSKVKKIDLNSTIEIKAIERDYSTKEIVKTASVTIDLSKDLELKEEIDQSNSLFEEKLGDVSFKHTKDDNFYHGTTSHAYSKKLVGENMSWSIKSQYGNSLVPEEHIEFYMEANVNNLSLEEAFEDYILISNKLGQYGLSDIYGVDFFDKDGNATGETETFTFNEMLKLAKGETVSKNGKKYDKSKFELADMEFEKLGNATIGKEIKAIKYSMPHQENVHYMFVYKDNIYNISCSTNPRTEKVVKMFLDSLELN